jgi:hypothetical protein
MAVRVHNAEGGRRTYTWTATVNAPGATPRRAARGRLTLEDGATEALRVAVPVTCTADRMRVEVSVGGPHRAVGVWVPCGEATP